MKLSIQECASALKEYGKWRRGKGKKYLVSDFKAERTNDALADAVKYLTILGRMVGKITGESHGEPSRKEG